MRSVDIASGFNHAMVSTSDDWTDAVDRIAHPTLVIHGANDPILPLPNGVALAHHVTGAQLLVLDETGHELNPLDIDEICRSIISFIADRDRRLGL